MNAKTKDLVVHFTNYWVATKDKIEDGETQGFTEPDIEGLRSAFKMLFDCAESLGLEAWQPDGTGVQASDN